MTIQCMEHVGIVVDDLATATAFFSELGLELQGEWSVEGDLVDRIVGLEGVQVDAAMMETPDGHGRLELVKFHPRRAREATGTRRRIPQASASRLRCRRHRRCPRRLASPRRRARRRGGELRRHLSALLRPRVCGDHRRAGREDRLRAS